MTQIDYSQNEELKRTFKRVLEQFIETGIPFTLEEEVIHEDINEYDHCQLVDILSQEDVINSYIFSDLDGRVMLSVTKSLKLNNSRELLEHIFNAFKLTFPKVVQDTLEPLGYKVLYDTREISVACGDIFQSYMEKDTEELAKCLAVFYKFYK